MSSHGFKYHALLNRLNSHRSGSAQNRANLPIPWVECSTLCWPITSNNSPDCKYYARRASYLLNRNSSIQRQFSTSTIEPSYCIEWSCTTHIPSNHASMEWISSPNVPPNGATTTNYPQLLCLASVLPSSGYPLPPIYPRNVVQASGYKISMISF